MRSAFPGKIALRHYVHPALLPDGAGGVVVSASVPDEGSFADAVLTNVALADGNERWTVNVNRPSPDINENAVSLGLDPQGDLIAGGILASAESGLRAAAVKLSHEDGHVLWQSVVDALHGSGRAVVDPAGDVFVPGTVKTGPYVPYGGGASTEMGPQPRAPDGLAAVKLSGADGHELWRWIESDGDGFSDMGRSAVDGAGNLLANVQRGFGERKSSSSTALAGPRCGSDRRLPCRPPIRGRTRLRRSRWTPRTT